MSRGYEWWMGWRAGFLVGMLSTAIFVRCLG